MRKIKEVLRLRYELDLDQRQIARSCSISVSTVHEYLKRAETAGVGWPVPVEWTDTQLQAALFPAPASPARPCKDSLDCEEIQRQLRSNRHVTLQLLWEEGSGANSELRQIRSLSTSRSAPTPIRRPRRLARSPASSRLTRPAYPY